MQSELRAVGPYFSLYLNGLGGGSGKVAQYFTPDEISELDARQAAEVVSQYAPWGARLATSKPMSMGFYLARDGRADIQVVPLYDPGYRLRIGDVVLREESRRYFETDRLLQWLPSSGIPHVDVQVGPVLATSVYGIRPAGSDPEVATLRPRFRPASLESISHVRLSGQARVTIEYRDYQLKEARAFEAIPQDIPVAASHDGGTPDARRSR
jgi:hypothetical protein